MTEEEIKIFVDDRQKIVNFEKVKRRLKEYEVIECRMEVGDIAFANVGLELKMADDFNTSFFQHKLARQTANVVRNYDIGRLVVIGDWKVDLLTKHRDAMRCYKSMLGQIATLTMFQTPPLFVSDVREFLTVLKTMVDYSFGEKKSSGVPILFAKKNRTIEQERSDLMTALEGVGRKEADRLLGAVGTIDKMVGMSVEDWTQIEGIGKKSATHFFEVFH